MRIIKVNAINSTNSFARDLYKNNFSNSPVCVVAREQTSGRGQRGASWHSKAGENLTFSIVFPNLDLQANCQFYISAAVAIGINKALSFYNIKNLKIKWPNDIMAANKKIGGVLIENFIVNGSLSTSIIGVGINVNQKTFEALPQASSLAKINGRLYDLDDVLQKILYAVEKALEKVQEGNFEELLENYYQHLFKIKTPSTFQLPDKTFFTGIIQGVTPTGKLQVQIEDEQLKEFDIKEVKLCY